MALNINRLYKRYIDYINGDLDIKIVLSFNENINKLYVEQKWLNIINKIQNLLFQRRASLAPALPASGVIKISNKQRTLYEKIIESNLKDIKGFINFERDFIYENNELCVIVMPYYKYGNIKEFLKDKKDLNLLKSLIKQVFLSYYTAFIEKSFIHNNSHLENILITNTTKEFEEYTNIDLLINLYGYKTILMDFNSSIINIEVEKRDFLDQLQLFYCNLCCGLSYLINDDNNIQELLFEYRYKQETMPKAIIINLINSIDNITIGNDKPTIKYL
jgi:hypothetical protein